MKPLKWLGIILVIYAAFVIAFEGLFLGWRQPTLEATGIPMLVLTTTDASGDTDSRRLARFRNDDGLYVSAHHWPRGWYSRAVANPNVRVDIDGVEADYLAVPVEGAEFDAVARDFRLGFVTRFLMGFPPERDILRLDPVATAGSTSMEVEAVSTNNISPDQSALAALAELPAEQPFVMLNLMEFSDGTGEIYAKYGANTLPQLEKRGGRIIYDGTPLIDTPEAGHWDRIALVYYPNRSAFFDMVTDPDYQRGLTDRTAGLKRTMVYAFTQSTNPDAPPLEAVPIHGGEEIFVLNLMRFKPNGGREEYGKYGAVVLPMVMARGGAPVLILNGRVPMVSEETWEDLYLVRYPDLEALQGMVATEEWQTANENRQRGLDLTWAFPTRP